MQPRHILAFFMRGDDLRNDLVERQWCGIDDARSLRAMRENSLRHQRAGIEAHRTGGDDIAPAQGKQIGSTRSGADEVHRHSPSPSAIAAVAVRSCETVREV